MRKSIIKPQQESSGDEGKSHKRNKSVTFSIDGETVSKKTKTEDPNPLTRPECRIFITRTKNFKRKVSDEFGAGPSNSKGFGSPTTRVATKEKRASTKTGPKERSDDSHEATGLTLGPKKTHKKKIKPTVDDSKLFVDAQNNSQIDRYERESNSVKTDGLNRKARRQSSDDDLSKIFKNLRIAEGGALADLLNEVSALELMVRPKQERINETTVTAGASQSHKGDIENIQKYTKKCGNRDHKGASTLGAQKYCVVVDNLSGSILGAYRKRLTDYFGTCGRIKRFGVAQKYTSAEGRLIFTTKIYFNTDEAAVRALERDKSFFAGSRIRVRRPLPPSETVCVVRCLADLTEHRISAIFSTVGTLLTIRLQPRHRSGMAVAFIEYEGSEAVERALSLSGIARVDWKKVYVDRYQKHSKTPPIPDSD